MNSKFIRVCAVILATGALVGSTVFAKDPANKKGDKQTLNKSAGTPRYAVLNINNLTAWFRSDGQSNHSPQADNGLYFPRGTANVIYQDGVVFGAKAFVGGFEGVGTAAPNQTVRVGGGTYGVGTRAGYVTGSGASAVAADPDDADVRIYRIRRDYTLLKNADGTYSADLRRDAGNVNEIPTTEVTDAQMEAVYQQYATDWTSWPVDKGAPYVDRNGDGVYTAPPAFGVGFTLDSLISQGIDEPGLAGVDPNSPADQVIWTVYNDLNLSQAQGFAASEPLGIEVQKTVWGYKRSDALGNLYFSKYKLINKGGVDISAAAGDQLGSFHIDSMYVCQWSDPDLGSFSDDLVGCDSVLSMGFIYNGNAVDGTYRNFGLAPAAAGYDFLAGPIVPSAGDTAVFDLKLRPGFRNLKMSSFAYFSAGSPYSDPPNGEAAGYASETGQWWKMLRGYAPLGTINTADVSYAFPPGVPTDPFPLSGDASNGSGFVDGQGTTYSFAPGDRRILLNTGPFQMAPGDTQEIVVGVVAGIGSDRRSSVTVMKFNDRFVQNTYDARFQVPAPPAAPDVKIAELDGEIILDWASNPSQQALIENTTTQPGNYVFEGYNIYQLPSSGAPRSQWTRVATFDLTSDPAVILDEQVDNSSGQVLQLPVQFGSNSGLKRDFIFARDYVQDIDKIYNGQEYYIVITAYTRSTIPGYLPSALESDPVVYTVRPKVPFGKVYTTAYGDVLTTTHSAGGSDGSVTPVVVNPTLSTGDTYEVRFDTSAGVTTWRLRNATDNVTLLSGQSNQSGDEEYAIVDGIRVKVAGPPPGLKTNAWSWTPSADRFLSWVGGEFGFEEFGTSIGYGSARSVFGDGTLFMGPTELKQIEIRFAATTDSVTGAFNTADPNASYAYRYGRGFGAAAADPAYTPYMLNGVGSYAYQDFTISVPLAVWDVDASPPRRLAVGFLENNAAPTAGVPAEARVNGLYWPPVLEDNVSGASPREWLFIFDEDYSTTPDPVYQAELIGGNQRGMYFSTMIRRNVNNWPAGGTNVFVLTPTRPNFVTDVFAFSAPAASAGASLETASADKVGVFPNPYYAFNAAESNRFNRFVTFNNLPPKATIRIFNLAGQLVRRIDKDDTSQFTRWDLANTSNFPVASGVYVAHLELMMPADNSVVTKILKVAVIQEQEILNSY